MKKIISLLIVLCMVFTCATLTACDDESAGQGNSSKSAAYKALSAATENTSKLDSMNAAMEMDMTVTVDGVSQSMNILYEITASGLQGNSPKLRMIMTSDLPGVNMDIYIADGWAYATIAGTSYKVSAEDSGFEIEDTANDVIQPLEDDLLKNVTLKTESDGSQSISLSLKSKDFKDIYDDMIESLLESVSANGTDLDALEISDTNLYIKMSDNYISEYNIDFTMDMTVSGTTAKVEATVCVTFNAPGQNVTVTPPEGYLSFPSVS